MRSVSIEQQVEAGQKFTALDLNAYFVLPVNYSCINSIQMH